MFSGIKKFFYFIVVASLISLAIEGAKRFNDIFSSDPIQGTFKVEKAEIIIPKKSSGGGKKKRTKTVTDGEPYLKIKLINDNGDKLNFSYKDVKSWKWSSKAPVGLNNIKAAILSAGNLNVKYRKGMLFSKIIDEVAINP